MSLPSMRRLVKAFRHGPRAGGTIYVGSLPINRGRDEDGSRVANLECATGSELPYAARVTVDIGADYFFSARQGWPLTHGSPPAWSFRSASCILRSTVRMVSNS